MIKRICIFGASIAFGASDYEFGGWQNYLKVWFAKRGKFQHVFNLAVSGRTTDDIIKRFKNELLARKSADPNNEIMALISIPVNDTRFTKNEKGREIMEVSEEQFLRNLQKMSELAEKYANKLVFLGITKVDDTKTSPWYVIEEEIYWRNEKIEKYNKIAEEFCQQNKIPFCPMHDLLTDDDLADGLHPNAEGHRKMFERVRDFLEEVL